MCFLFYRKKLNKPFGQHNTKYLLFRMQRWSFQQTHDLGPQLPPQNLGYHLHFSLYRSKILIEKAYYFTSFQ